MSADEDTRQIRALVDSWIAASKAHDLPALMDMMTDDVVFMTPGRAPFGKAEFAADSERMKGVAIDARAEVRRSRSSVRGPTSATMFGSSLRSRVKRRSACRDTR